MISGSLPRLRIATLRGLGFAAVVMGGLAFPAGLGGYVAVYVWVAAGAALLLLTQRLALRPEALILGGTFIALGLGSAVLAPNIWQAREYVRAVLFIYLLFALDSQTRRTALFAIATAAVALITFDFIVLRLLDVDVLKVLLYQRGMQSYVSDYWRHVGFLGNPNSSAAFYAIAIVACTALILARGLEGTIRKVLVSYCLVMSVTLLALTLSRTAMIATAGSVLVMIAVRIRRVRQFLTGLAFVSFVAVIWLTDAGGIQSRFGSTSSLLERLHLWQSLLHSVTAESLIAGGWDDVPVVDNDLVYFVHNFGLLGAITNYLVVLIMALRLWVAGFRTVMAGFLALVILLGAGMGFFADPKFALLVFAGSTLIPPPASRTTRAPEVGRAHAIQPASPGHIQANESIRVSEAG